ncbi:MAG TPA: hypothetical protein VFE38_02540 [Edaphobacter sp.]|nr:hypothetical protein [Edaphobacter sp.]
MTTQTTGKGFRLRRGVITLALAGFMTLPASGFAQTTDTQTETQAQRHERAKRAQDAHDKKHHTGAKVIGGSAAGGAVAGALLGGGKGALIGGAVGAGGGAVANKVRKDKDVKKREQQEQRDDKR